MSESKPQQENKPLLPSAPSAPTDETKTDWTGLKRILIYWGLYTASMMVIPILPGIKKDYFGDDKTAAMYQSMLDCSVALVGLFTASIYGMLMDSLGRRVFFLIGSAWNMIAIFILLVFYDYIVVFMIVYGSTKIIQVSYAFSMITDLYNAKSRTVAFAAMVAVGGGTAMTSLYVAFASRGSVIAASLVFSAFAFIYALFSIPETLAPDLVKPFSLKSLENPFASMKELVRSKAVMGCVAIFGFFMIAQVGTGEIYMYYLNDRIDFNDTDNAIAYVESGFLTPIIQLIVFPLLSKRMSSVKIIMVCLASLLVELVMIGAAFAKWPMFAFAVPLLALTQMLVPTVYAILANTGTDEDQGRRMAGITAVSDLCQAIGPLFFGQLYAHSSGWWGILPFALSAGFVFPCVFLTLRIEKWVEETRSTRRMSRMRSTAPQEPPKDETKAAIQ